MKNTEWFQSYVGQKMRIRDKKSVVRFKKEALESRYETRVITTVFSTLQVSNAGTIVLKVLKYACQPLHYSQSLFS